MSRYLHQNCSIFTLRITYDLGGLLSHLCRIYLFATVDKLSPKLLSSILYLTTVVIPVPMKWCMTTTKSKSGSHHQRTNRQRTDRQRETHQQAIHQQNISLPRQYLRQRDKLSKELFANGTCRQFS